MQGYKVIEAAVRQHILRTFGDILNGENCQVANIDGVFQAIQASDLTYGCVLDYSDGRRQPRGGSFTTDMWVWQIVGFFLIRYRNNVAEHDQQVREVVDRLSMLFEDPNDKRLGGLSPLVNIVAISAPEPEYINDVPFYWLAFNIEAADR